jgi:phage protein D
MPALVPTITSEGRPLDPDVRVHSIEVRKELGRIPEARLVLYDGSVADREFKVSNTAFFEPGKQIRITLREGDDPPKPLFTGLVVRHTVQAEANRVELRVELRDAAIALTRQRKGVIHRNQRDGDIVRKLARAARLRLGRIDATRVRHQEIVQFQATDWDFLLSRADVNGQVVIVDDGARCRCAR